MLKYFWVLKNIVISLLIIFISYNYTNAETVSNYVWTVTIQNNWNATWANPNNIIWNTTWTFSQSSLSTNPSNSNTLLLRWFDFKNANIPVWAQINWIQVDVEWNWSNNAVTDFRVELTKNWNDIYTSNLWLWTSQTTKWIRTYWWNNDLWWTTWSDTEIKSDNFWVLLQYRKTWWWTRTARVYRVNVTIDYSMPAEISPLDFNITQENYWWSWFCYEFEATNNTILDLINWEIWFNINWANINSSWWWNFTNLWWWEYIITSPWAWADSFGSWQTLSFWFCADNWTWYVSNLLTKNYETWLWLLLQDYNLNDNWLQLNVTTNSSWWWGYCRNIELINNWENAIEWWKINFELDQNLTSSFWWNFSQNWNLHTIYPLWYNQRINVWESYSLWFCTNWFNVDNNWNLDTIIWTPWFCWKYYNWTATEPYNLMNFILAKTDTQIFFDWWTWSPDPLIPIDDFTVEWEWKFQARESWIHTFRTRSDDWARVYINGTMIINRWIDQAPTIEIWTINLQAWEFYDIRVEYYERWWWAVMEFDWQKPSDTWFVSFDQNIVSHWTCRWWIFWTLETTFAWWNSQRWNMFNVNTKQDSLIIQWFSINSQATTWEVVIYYKDWSYIWSETNPWAWNLIWNYNFTWWWTWNAAFVQIDEVILNPNSSYSFYISVVSWTNINYTNWTTEWAIFAEDDYLIFREWIWIQHEFWPTSWRPRIWNGRIHYDINEEDIIIITEWEITTTFVWWNWQAGNMFDVDVLWTPLEITGISVNTQNANWTIRVYYREWYYAWFENSSAWWNLVWDYNYTWAWTNNPTFINIDNVELNANTSYSFYVTDISWWGIRYTTTNNEWAIFISNSYLQIREWIWKAFEFAWSFRPRMWNWTLHYSLILEPDDNIPPVLEINNLIEENIYPNINLNIEVSYNDLESWINISSINAELRKWNWTNWWSNILSSFLNSSNSNTTNSNYNLNQLWLWKYRFYFYIEDNAWNSSFDEKIFYIDEPNFQVSSSNLNLWNLDTSNNNFSNNLNLTVRTVWAPFEIRMNQNWNLTNWSIEIVNWNWINWFGFEQSPFTNNINIIQNNQLIWTQNANTNINWEYNTYIYTIRFWANINDEQSAWQYQTNIDFDISFNY